MQEYKELLKVLESSIGKAVYKHGWLSKLVKNDDIISNDCNLSVSSYVEQEDTREVINISKVNAKLRDLVSEGNELNQKIDAIIKELGE